MLKMSKTLVFWAAVLGASNPVVYAQKAEEPLLDENIAIRELIKEVISVKPVEEQIPLQKFERYDVDDVFFPGKESVTAYRLLPKASDYPYYTVPRAEDWILAQIPKKLLKYKGIVDEVDVLYLAKCEAGGAPPKSLIDEFGSEDTLPNEIVSNIDQARIELALEQANITDVAPYSVSRSERWSDQPDSSLKKLNEILNRDLVRASQTAPFQGAVPKLVLEPYCGKIGKPRELLAKADRSPIPAPPPPPPSPPPRILPTYFALSSSPSNATYYVSSRGRARVCAYRNKGKATATNCSTWKSVNAEDWIPSRPGPWRIIAERNGVRKYKDVRVNRSHLVTSPVSQALNPLRVIFTWP